MVRLIFIETTVDSPCWNVYFWTRWRIEIFGLSVTVLLTTAIFASYRPLRHYIRLDCFKSINEPAGIIILPKIKRASRIVGILILPKIARFTNSRNQNVTIKIFLTIRTWYCIIYCIIAAKAGPYEWFIFIHIIITYKFLWTFVSIY